MNIGQLYKLEFPLDCKRVMRKFLIIIKISLKGQEEMQPKTELGM